MLELKDKNFYCIEYICFEKKNKIKEIFHVLAEDPKRRRNR